MVSLLQAIPDYAISIVEALGSQSRLIADALPEQGVVQLGTAFETIALLAALVYIFFGVRYYNYIQYSILAALGIKYIERHSIYLSRGEQSNFLMIMLGTGSLLGVMAATKALASYRSDLLVEGISTVSAYAIMALSIALLVGAVLLLYIVSLKVIAFVSEQRQLCRELLQKRLHSAALAFTIAVPLLTLYQLSAIGSMAIAVMLALVVVLAEIISIKETFFCFRHQKLSILHWFLYLCALEIFPASLMLAPLLRESCGM